MSQPGERYVRKCNESASTTAEKVVGSRVKTKAITMETETPQAPIEQPQGVQVQVQHVIPDQSEDEDDEFWPLSGKPHFDVVIAKTHLGGMYRMTIPSRIQKELPCATDFPVVVKYRGKKWEMVNAEDGKKRRKFVRAGWKEFAVDNDLKIGDACVFELVECRSDSIEFKVQILRGDFPAELLERVEGLTRENPLVVN